MNQTPEGAPWTFQDKKYGIEFIVTYDHKLTESQLHWIAQTVIRKHQDSLFQAWRLTPQNQDWQGNVEKKKDELFRLSPLPRTVEVHRDFADVCLRGFQPPT